MYMLHTLFLNNQWVKEEIKEETSNSLAQIKMKEQHTKIYGIQQKQT